MHIHQCRYTYTLGTYFVITNGVRRNLIWCVFESELKTKNNHETFEQKMFLLWQLIGFSNTLKRMDRFFKQKLKKPKQITPSIKLDFANPNWMDLNCTIESLYNLHFRFLKQSICETNLIIICKSSHVWWDKKIFPICSLSMCKTTLCETLFVRWIFERKKIVEEKRSMEERVNYLNFKINIKCFKRCRIVLSIILYSL